MCSHLQRGSQYLLTRQWNQGTNVPENINETRDNDKEWEHEDRLAGHSEIDSIIHF
jgi:hypothetical protein